MGPSAARETCMRDGPRCHVMFVSSTEVSCHVDGNCSVSHASCIVDLETGHG